MSDSNVTELREVCGDDRFDLIAKARETLIDRTNIEMRQDEMNVLDSILFRCWQMGWLDQLRDTPEQAVAATLGSEPDETELTQTYDAGFENGVMAVFQQLEGVEDYEELQDLIAEYWAEGEGYDER